MIRKVDLVSYLPPFMQTYREPVAALEAENPEFILVWSATDRVLKNRFIETADEYGISRYEKMLGIYPSIDDTLESRRSRVRSKWFNTIPYTMKVLIQKLTVICGDSNYTLIGNFAEGYTLTILTDLEMYGQVDELEDMLQAMLPLNIVPDIQNTFPLNVSGGLGVTGGVAYAEYFFITPDEKTEPKIKGELNISSGIINTARVYISNDFKEKMVVNSNKNVAVGVTVTEIITQGKEG